MKEYSLSTKVTISFGLCIFLLFISMLTFGKFENERELEKFKVRHFQAINYLATLYQNNVPPDDIEVYFKNFGLNIVENIDLVNYILTNGSIVFQRPSDLGMVSIYEYNEKYYLFLENNINVRVLLESTISMPNDKRTMWFFMVVFVLITWTYISTLSSISPLNKLRQVVRRFASGNLDIECKSDRHDEIGELANEFDKAIHTIRDLVTSRQLFLRTIMHELKTPIGKGRILTEMVHDELQKERFKNIFERLEILIDGFSKMEQLISKNYSLEKQKYALLTILESAFDILLLEPEQMKERIVLKPGKKSLHVNADLKLMSFAFKNLIDNALKYSSDKKVLITIKDNIISFSNKGEPLKRPIGELMQAFITTAKKEDNQTGLGLGLYIIENILKMHRLKLNYTYEESTHRHCFYIDLSNIVEKHKEKNEIRKV